MNYGDEKYFSNSRAFGRLTFILFTSSASTHYKQPIFGAAYEGTMMNDLDEADLRILRAVQKDCSRSTAELAELVGLSQPACWRRLQRLRQSGYITKEVAILDRKRLGFDAQVYALVKMSTTGRANLSVCIDAIRALPEVIECHVLMGSADFLLKILTRDIDAYERFFFERLSTIEGIQDITSSVALSEIKPLSGVPI